MGLEMESKINNEIPDFLLNYVNKLRLPDYRDELSTYFPVFQPKNKGLPIYWESPVAFAASMITLATAFGCEMNTT